MLGTNFSRYAREFLVLWFQAKKLILQVKLHNDGKRNRSQSLAGQHALGLFHLPGLDICLFDPSTKSQNLSDFLHSFFLLSFDVSRVEHDFAE